MGDFDPTWKAFLCGETERVNSALHLLLMWLKGSYRARWLRAEILKPVYCFGIRCLGDETRSLLKEWLRVMKAAVLPEVLERAEKGDERYLYELNDFVVEMHEAIKKSEYQEHTFSIL